MSLAAVAPKSSSAGGGGGEGIGSGSGSEWNPLAYFFAFFFSDMFETNGGVRNCPQRRNEQSRPKVTIERDQ